MFFNWWIDKWTVIYPYVEYHSVVKRNKQVVHIRTWVNLLIIFIEYNCFATLLVSAEQLSGSAICIHISPLSWASLPPSQSTHLGHHMGIPGGPRHPIDFRSGAAMIQNEPETSPSAIDWGSAQTPGLGACWNVKVLPIAKAETIWTTK